MDTLTHGLAGALLGAAIPATGDPALDLRLRRREMVVGFVAAMLPDADALVSPFSAEFYITQHRGLTHSFVLLPLWAALFAAAALLPSLLRRERDRLVFRRLALVSGLGVLSHILLDWVTSWGTMFLSPLSWARYQLDWVFILDLALSGILAIGLAGTGILLRRSGDGAGRRGARAALVAATAYVFLCGWRHGQALDVARRLAPPSSRSVAAIPQPVSPDRWLLLWDDASTVSTVFVDLSRHGPDPSPSAGWTVLEGARSAGDVWRSIPRLGAAYRSRDDLEVRRIPRSDGELARRTLDEGLAGVFGRFARFPAARQESTREGVTVTLRDARFGYLSPVVDPFTYQVRFDADGHLAFAGFPSPRWRRRDSLAVSLSGR